MNAHASVHVTRDVYLAIGLFRFMWRHPCKADCRACAAPATHVRVTLRDNARRYQEPGRFAAQSYTHSSAWCAAHLDRERHRSGLMVFDTVEKVYAILDELDANAQAAEQAANAQAAEQAARQLSVQNDAEPVRVPAMILRASGYAGTLYEKRDGDFEVLRLRFNPAAATSESVCCLPQGLWLIDLRDRGMRIGSPRDHAAQCPVAGPRRPIVFDEFLR